MTTTADPWDRLLAAERGDGPPVVMAVTGPNSLSSPGHEDEPVSTVHAVDSDELVHVTITRSAGADGAVLVLVDLPIDGPEVRVLVNDESVYQDRPYETVDGEGTQREAGEVSVGATAEDIGYTGRTRQ